MDPCSRAFSCWTHPHRPALEPHWSPAWTSHLIHKYTYQTWMADQADLQWSAVRNSETSVWPVYLSWRESWILSRFLGSMFLELGLRTGAWSRSLAISNTSTRGRSRCLDKWRQALTHTVTHKTESYGAAESLSKQWFSTCFGSCPHTVLTDWLRYPFTDIPINFNHWSITCGYFTIYHYLKLFPILKNYFQLFLQFIHYLCIWSIHLLIHYFTLNNFNCLSITFSCLFQLFIHLYFSSFNFSAHLLTSLHALSTHGVQVLQMT